MPSRYNNNIKGDVGIAKDNSCLDVHNNIEDNNKTCC